jgi:hypothetical protein
MIENIEEHESSFLLLMFIHSPTKFFYARIGWV